MNAIYLSFITFIGQPFLYICKNCIQKLVTDSPYTTSE